MSKERQYVYSEEIYDLIFYVKGTDGYEIIDEKQLKHIPKVGDYYIPLFAKCIYIVKAVIHDDIQTYIVLEKAENEFSEIATMLYQQKEKEETKN